MVITTLLITVGLCIAGYSKFKRISRHANDFVNNRKYQMGFTDEEAKLQWIGIGITILGFIVGGTLGI